MGGRQIQLIASKSKMGFTHKNEATDIVTGKDQPPNVNRMHPPIVASYNDSIRPLLDCVDKLRNLKAMQEGIQLPTIVVVGDQSSGKSSVLESLAGISLPRGQGICTRAPLIMRLQNHPTSQPEMTLEFNGRVIPTNEENVAESIILATDEVAGSTKGISNTPLTLTVKRQGVPDLTMIDLPGITRVPVHGQPEDIYEQISAIIMEYIKPEESIILNVLPANVDFPTCESIRMSQKVDKTGERTLAVVTKADMAPEGLLEKVTTDDVNIGLGYVIVRNRIGDESYEEARAQEALLFDDHPLLSSINKNMVGIPALAQKLVQIQATLISKCLPEIVRKINDKLAYNVAELDKLPQNPTSVGEAFAMLMKVSSDAKESLNKIFLRGELDEYPDDKDMHCSARLAEMLDHYANELKMLQLENESVQDFLLEEIAILEETKCIGLPNFLPRAAFLTILQKKVKRISSTSIEFVSKVWNYVERVLICVLTKHSDNNPQLQYQFRRTVKSLIAKKMEQSKDRVMEMIEMEKQGDYTCHPEYLSTWNNLMAKQSEFMRIMNKSNMSSTMNRSHMSLTMQQIDVFQIDVFGTIDVGHLKHLGVGVVQQAFDLKMRMVAYWGIVLRRLVDSLALHVTFCIRNVNNEIETTIVTELVGGAQGGVGIEKMLEESPAVAEKRVRLTRSIKLLKECKEVVVNTMDEVAAYSGQWSKGNFMPY